MTNNSETNNSNSVISKLTNRLIDLSKRNRLLNTPSLDPSRRGGLSTVPIISPDIYAQLEILNTRAKGILFSPKLQEVPPYENVGIIKPRRTNDTFYTSYDDKQLRAALTNMRSRGKASIDERGVNILFVALGFVEWDDPATPEERWRAPLLLSPITIEHQNGDFAIWSTNDITFLNPALIYKFSYEYKIVLPENIEDPTREEFQEYVIACSTILKNKQKNFNGYCKIVDSGAIGIFSFAKIAMFRELIDLGPQKLLQNATIASLVDSNHEFESSVVDNLDVNLDDYLDTQRPALVLEADSSQIEAVQISRTGKNMAIQGPPGTGKSQTIVNLIADALSRDQTVLFVAEKRVALDVVQKRLKNVGLENASLVIHPGKPQGRTNSETINKKAIIEEIERTLQSSKPRPPEDIEANYIELKSSKNVIRRYDTELHAPRFGCQKTIYEIHGYLEKGNPVPLVRQKIEDAPNISIAELRSRQGKLDEFIELKDLIYTTKLKTLWFNLLPSYPTEDYINEVVELIEEIHDIELESINTIEAINVKTNLTFSKDIKSLSTLCDFLSSYRFDVLLVPDLPHIAKRFTGKYNGLLKIFHKSSYQKESQLLKDYWLTDWPDNPKTIGAKLIWFENIRVALKINPDYAILKDNYNLSKEADNLKDLIARLHQCQGKLKNYFDAEFIEQLQIGQIISQKQIEFCNNLLSQKHLVKSSIMFREKINCKEGEILKPFISLATNSDIPVEIWRDAYEKSFWQTLLEAALALNPSLANFNSSSHERIITKFRELDRKSASLAVYQVKDKLYDRRPRIVTEMKNAGSAEIVLLMKEFKKQRIKPLRRLFSQSPNAILDIKPCFMMSPLSISQYLDPELFHFDVVIFDEASQIRMEDALGAIYRGKQIIVVGDEQQLPPTRFFDAWDSGDDYDEEDDINDAIDFESILTRAEGGPRTFQPVKLRWHYRSLHEELIAFSNKIFYDNHLYTFPNPGQNQEKAIEYIYVEGGIYDRGRSRTNIVEARIVAKKCLEFAREYPNLSLGVVTFSEAQKQVILDEIDRLLIANPELTPFFEEDRNNSEPFTVKNLELIQGDERDTIFFSFGYGKDQTGAFSQNFGPLNQDAGRRRLNVAVTRARRSVILFSSVLPEDLTSDTLGVKLMKDYMTLARDGLSALYGNPTTANSLGETESRFEEAVASRLRQKGLEVHSQIGCSGYRIDLGIVDPMIPGRYVLGVECDGAMYHSGKTVRDKDRLRQEVLESLGWRIIRVWSRSWNENPEREVGKILEAVRMHKGRIVPEGRGDQTSVYQKNEATHEIDSVETFQPISIKRKHPTKFSKLIFSSRHVRNGTTLLLAEDIAAIVKEQGPTQWEQLVKQVCTLWGYKRVGDNIRLAIEDGIRKAFQNRLVEVKGEPKFIYPINPRPITIKISESSNIRKVDEIPIEELHLALWIAVAESGGSLESQDAIRIASVLFGYQALTSSFTDRMMEAIYQSASISKNAFGNVEVPLSFTDNRISLLKSKKGDFH